MILDVKKNIFFGILLSLITFLFIFIPGSKVSAGEPISTVGTNIYNLEDCTYFTYTEEQIDNLITTAKAKLVEKGVNADAFNKFNLVAYKGTYGNEIRFYLYNDYDIDNNRITFDFTGTPSVPFKVHYYYSNGIMIYSKRNATDPGKLVYDYFNSPKTNVNSFFNYAENNDGSGVYILTNFDLKNQSNEVIISQNYGVKNINFDYQYDKKRGPLDKLYSIDYIFDSNTFTSDTAIQYEINYIDEYEKYSDENISSYLYLNGFKFYGLVNDNGLYHWEELDNTSNSYVDDYEDYYQDGKYYFNVKKMNLDFTNYEKIIFRSIFFNDNYLESAVTRSNNEKISRDDVFYNTVFGPTYLNMQFDTKELFYLNMTSTLSEYKSRWYTWDYSDSDPYKQPYLNYFDLTTSQFVSESHGLPLYYANDLNYDFIEKHDVVIGTSTNKGVVITEEFKKRSVAGLVFTYREQFTYNVIFEFKDLYFSYNNTNDNEKKIYIDKDGNRYQDDGVKASNTNVEQFEGTNALENITDFLNDLRLTSDYFNYNFELNWNKLPGNIQGLILFVFNMSCILVILRIGGYK